MAKIDNKAKQPRKESAQKGKAAASADAKKKKAEKSDRKMDGRRETIESVVVAFILAFLFRTFEAEAFVIPTGSMAPTLLGRHKGCECPECGYHFSIGASDEVEQPGLLKPGERVRSAVCPNCFAVVPASALLDMPVFKGDRILVDKYPYEFGDPKRWDVVVFKFPEEPKTNYIKRLVGLPGEKLEVRQGNVYAISDQGILKILRKEDLKKQRALQILVYDNDFSARKLEKLGFPQRWSAVIQNSRPGSIDGWSKTNSGWKKGDGGRAFHLDSQSDSTEYRWLRYRNFVPSEEDWNSARKGNSPPHPRPQLITDFCGYNAYVTGPLVQRGNLSSAEFEEARKEAERMDADNRIMKIGRGLYWVGELTINCKLTVREIGKDGELVLELNQGQRKYRCTINVNNGVATLLHNDANKKDEKNEKSIDWIKLATAETELREPGEYRLTFANVDHRLSLWVNDKLIDFGRTEEGQSKSIYKAWGTRGYQTPVNGDLIPVGIAAKGLSLSVSKLLLQRDIYYRGEHFIRNPPEGGGLRTEYEYGPAHNARGEVVYPNQLSANAHDPAEWYDEYSKHKFPARFPRLAKNEYFMMGDNSPRSKDSRLWDDVYRSRRKRNWNGHFHAVPRSKLVGRAYFIYWPHGVPFLNGGKGYPVFYHKTVQGEGTNYPSFRVPFYPNFSRMRRIR